MILSNNDKKKNNKNKKRKRDHTSGQIFKGGSKKDKKS